MNEKLIDLLDTTSNMLRGMCMDPAIPEHAKEAMRVRIERLDEAVTLALDDLADGKD